MPASAGQRGEEKSQDHPCFHVHNGPPMARIRLCRLLSQEEDPKENSGGEERRAGSLSVPHFATLCANCLLATGYLFDFAAAQEGSNEGQRLFSQSVPGRLLGKG